MDKIAMTWRRIALLIFGFLQIQQNAGWESSGREIPGWKSSGREIPGWERGVVRRTSAYIDPLRDTTIIGGREICQDPDSKIVIVVESTPADSKFRTAIRKSWGADKSVRVGFLLGVTKGDGTQDRLWNESIQYRDIIQDSFVESYYNLTLKGISILKWFIRTCPYANFLVKADHDTYIDVPRLNERLAKFHGASGVLRGYLCSDFDRDDRLESKYYAPMYMYPGNIYPDFLQGSAYYMTRDVAVKLFETAMKTPIFHLEDVYITGICAKIAGVKPRKDPGVYYLFGSPAEECLTRYIITCNSVLPQEMEWLLDQFRQTPFNNTLIDKEENIKRFPWTRTSEPFVYVTEKETLLINDTNILGNLRSMDLPSSAPSMEKELFACAVHAVLFFCILKVNSIMIP